MKKRYPKYQKAGKRTAQVLLCACAFAYAYTLYKLWYHQEIPLWFAALTYISFMWAMYRLGYLK